MTAGVSSLVYHPGSGPLHRAPVGLKLAGLGGLSLGVALTDGVAVDVAGLSLALAAHLVARLPVRSLRRVVVPVLLLTLPIGVWLGVTRGWETGLSAAADVVAIVVLAGVVTGTTAPADLLDLLTGALGPVGRLPLVGRRVDVEQVALTFSLTLAAIPAVARAVGDAREAAAARGLHRSWRAVLVPSALRTVAHAFAVSDALAARGLGD